MATKASAVSPEKRWVEQWKRASDALEEQRARELREMTPEDALAASDALLELGAKTRLNPSRAQTSGLVEQQALFHKKSSR